MYFNRINKKKIKQGGLFYYIFLLPSICSDYTFLGHITNRRQASSVCPTACSKVVFVFWFCIGNIFRIGA